MQIEDREHLGHLRRLPSVRRQDLRAVPLALPGLLIDALVVDPRRADRHGPRPDRHLPLPRATVADHQPLPVPADERADVLIDLGLQRRRDHPTRTLARETIKRDPHRVVLPNGEPANILHGVPSCRSSPASVFSNREGTPPSSSTASTTSGYSSLRVSSRATWAHPNS